jgi:hypothetical protein
MLNNDLITAIVCTIIGIVFLLGSLSYTYLGKIFPMVISIALIIMSIILLIKSIISPELSGWLKQIKIKNVIIIAVGVAIYVIAIPILGIIVASTIYIIAFSLVAAPEVNKATVATSIIVAVGVSASFSYVFIKYFYVPLPSGIFS